MGKAKRKSVKGTEGKVIQVIGPVVDIEFPSTEVPAVYNAIEIEIDGKGKGKRAPLIVEVMRGDVFHRRSCAWGQGCGYA